MSTTVSHHQKTTSTGQTGSIPSLTTTASPGDSQHERVGVTATDNVRMSTENSRKNRNDNSNPQQGTGGDSAPGQERPGTAGAPPVTDGIDAPTPPPLQQWQQHQARRNHSKIPPTLKDSRKLFVGGLPSDVTDQEFRTYFEQFGSVMDSVVMFDRETHRSRGFGFVTFEDVSVARQVLGIGEDEPVVGSSSRMEMRGKVIEIKAAQPKESSSSLSGSGRHYQRFHRPSNNNSKEQQQDNREDGNYKSNGNRYYQKQQQREAPAPAPASAPVPSSGPVPEPMAMGNYGAAPFVAAEYHHAAWAGAAVSPAYYHAAAVGYAHPAAAAAAAPGYVAGYMAPVSYYAPGNMQAPLTEDGGDGVHHLPPPPCSAALMANPVEGVAAPGVAPVPPGALPLAHVMHQQQHQQHQVHGDGTGVGPSVVPHALAFFPSVAFPYPAAMTTEAAVEVDENKEDEGEASPAAATDA